MSDMEKNVLREELKDEALDAVAGGYKKYTVKDYIKGQQKLTDADKRAQELKQQEQGRRF